MRPEQKTKSRTKLYQAIEGAKEITGAAGKLANWTIEFAELAAATDTVQIGPYYFQFVADGSEDTPGDSAGTAADPHLITIGGTPTATTAAASLVAALLAETATTGAWGYLYPDDSVGASNSAGVVTINFWPGTFANAATYIPDASFVGTNPTVTNVADGVTTPSIDPSVKINIIDTTGSAQNQEYYSLADGDTIGQEAKIMVKTFAASDTPTVIGHFEEIGTAMVEMEFVTGEPGVTVDLVWTGVAWELANYSAFATIPDFTAAA